jgi:hypothetical protein
MPSPSRRLIVLAFLVAGSPAWAAVPLERQSAGFVFVTPAAGKASLLEKPEAGAKAVGSPPTGARLVYRKLVEVEGKAAWYRVEPPAGVAGWIAARDVSLTRPSTLPVSKPMKLIEGRTAVVGSSSSTSAARGLDGRAREYAASKADLAVAVEQFAALETEVLARFSKAGEFDDKLDANGNYADVDNPVRKRKAQEFKAGVK